MKKTKIKLIGVLSAISFSVILGTTFYGGLLNLNNIQNNNNLTRTDVLLIGDNTPPTNQAHMSFLIDGINIYNASSRTDTDKTNLINRANVQQFSNLKAADFIADKFSIAYTNNTVVVTANSGFTFGAGKALVSKSGVIPGSINSGPTTITNIRNLIGAVKTYQAITNPTDVQKTNMTNKLNYKAFTGFQKANLDNFVITYNETAGNESVILTAKDGFTFASGTTLVSQYDEIVPYSGETLNKSDLAGIGWDSATTITLEDWENWAPNVIQLGTSINDENDSTTAPFYQNTTLKSIVIPNTIKIIGSGAFGMSVIDSITFEPESTLTTISRAAFYKVTSFNQDFILPDSVTHIYSGVFFETNFNGKQLIINPTSSLTSLSGFMFSNATNIGNTIYIPDSITTLVFNVFVNTSSLTNGFSISSKFRTGAAPIYGFTQNQWDTKITWRLEPYLGTILKKSDLFSILWDKKIAITLEDWKASAPDVIQLGVDVDGSNWGPTAPFDNNTTLKLIQIPNTIKTIGSWAFGNTRLETITFEPESTLTTISRSAFESSSIRSNDFILPDSVTSIYNNAFKGTNFNGNKFIINPTSSLPSLHSWIFNAATNIANMIHIPDSIAFIGSISFTNTTTLTHGFSIPGKFRTGTTPMYGFTQEQWDNTITWRPETFLGAILEKTDLLSMAWDKKSTITLEDWENWAPNVIQLGTTIEWENDSTTAPFFGNEFLKSIVIPNTIKIIGSWAFGSTILDSITFEEASTLTTISYAAFNSSSISTNGFILPDSVTHIYSEVFSDTNFNGNQFIINPTSSLTSLSAGIFGRATGITNMIHIPDGITTLLDIVFTDTTTLTNGFSISGKFKTGTTPMYGFTQEQWNNKITWRPEPYLGAILKKTDLLSMLWDTKTSISLQDWKDFAPRVTQLGAEINENNNAPTAPFFGNTFLKSIVIPNTIKIIGSGAFGMSVIDSITFEPESTLTTISRAAFYKVTSFNQDFILPDSVTHLYNGVFYETNFNGNKFIINPTSSLTSLSEVMFSKATNIGNTIYIPDGITTLVFNVFVNTSSLTNGFSISGKFRTGTTPTYGFTQTQWDTTITWRPELFLDEILNKSDLLSMLWDKKIAITLEDWANWAPNVKQLGTSINDENDSTTAPFKGNTTLKSIVIPNTIEIIGSFAFAESTIETITFEETSALTTISMDAFLGCTNWTSDFTLPDSVTHIYKEAFRRTNFNGKQLIINSSSSLTTLGAGIFGSATNIVNMIHIPNTVITLLDNPFSSTSGLIGGFSISGKFRTSASAMYGFSQVQWDTKITWREAPFLGTILNKSDLLSMVWDKKIAITLEDWANWAPHVKQLGTSTNDENDFTTAPFYDNKVLKSIEIPNTIEIIGSYAFSKSTIETITFEETSTLTAISIAAFLGCTNWTSNFTLPDSVTHIYKEAFRRTNFNGNQFIINPSSSLTTLGAGIFGNATNIVNMIHIPNTVITLLDNVFTSTTGLTGGFSISGKFRTSASAMYGFTQNQWDTKITWRPAPFLGEILNKSDLLSMVWEEKIAITLEDWANWAPYVKQLGTSINDENDSTTAPFYRNTTLKSIEIPNTIEIIGSFAFAESTIETITFQSESALTTISMDAFLGCTNWKSDFILPDSVTHIYKEAFRRTNFNRLQLIINETSRLQSLSTGIFGNATNIANMIHIPSSVADIPSDSFIETTSLTNGFSIEAKWRTADIAMYGFNQAQWDGQVQWRGTIEIYDKLGSPIKIDGFVNGGIIGSFPMTANMSGANSPYTNLLNVQYAIGTSSSSPFIIDWTDEININKAISDYLLVNDILKSDLNIFAKLVLTNGTGPDKDTIDGQKYDWDKIPVEIYNESTGTNSIYVNAGAGIYIKALATIKSDWAESLIVEGVTIDKVNIASKENLINLANYTQRGIELQYKNSVSGSWTRILSFDNTFYDASKENKLYFRLFISTANQAYYAIVGDAAVSQFESNVIEVEAIGRKILSTNTDWLNLIEITGNTKDIVINETKFKEELEKTIPIPNSNGIIVLYYFGGTPNINITPPTPNWYTESQIKTIFAGLKGAKNDKELILARNTLEVRYSLDNDTFKEYALNINGITYLDQFPTLSSYNHIVTPTLNNSFKGYINMDLISEFIGDSFTITGTNKLPKLNTINEQLIDKLSYYQIDSPFTIYYTNDKLNWPPNQIIFDESGFNDSFISGFQIKVDSSGNALPIYFKLEAKTGYSVWENNSELNSGKEIDIRNISIKIEIENPLTVPPIVSFIGYENSGSFKTYVDNSKVQEVTPDFLNALFLDTKPFPLRLEYNVHNFKYTPEELINVTNSIDEKVWLRTLPINLSVGQYIIVRVAINNDNFHFPGAKLFDAQTKQIRVFGLKIHADSLNINKDSIQLSNSEDFNLDPLDGNSFISEIKINSGTIYPNDYVGADLLMSVNSEFYENEGGIILDVNGIPIIKRNSIGATQQGTYKDSLGNDILDGTGNLIPIWMKEIDNVWIPAEPLTTGAWKAAYPMDLLSNGIFSQNSNSGNFAWKLFQNQYVKFSFIARVGDAEPGESDFIFDSSVAPVTEVKLDNIKYPINMNGIEYIWDQNITIDYLPDDSTQDKPLNGFSHINSILIASRSQDGSTPVKLSGDEIAQKVLEDYKGMLKVQMTHHRPGSSSKIVDGINISQFNKLRNGDTIIIDFASTNPNFTLPKKYIPFIINVTGLFAPDVNENIFEYLRPNFVGHINSGGSFNIRVSNSELSPDENNDKVLGDELWYEYQVWNSDETIKTSWTKKEENIKNLTNGDKIEWKLVSSVGQLSDDYYNTLRYPGPKGEPIKFKIVNVVDYVETTWKEGKGQSKIDNPDVDGVSQFPKNSGWIVSGLKTEIILDKDELDFYKQIIGRFNPMFYGIDSFGKMESNINNDNLISNNVKIVWNTSKADDSHARIITDFEKANLSNGDKVWTSLASNNSDLILSHVDYVNSAKFVVEDLLISQSNESQTLLIGLITTSSVLFIGIIALVIYVNKHKKLDNNKGFRK